MSQPIGIRLPDEIMKKIEKLGKKEFEDRSSIIRKLVILGYNDYMKKYVLDEYKKGNMTMSQAAHLADLTIWEMEQYFISQGFGSDYSIDDLEEELKILK